MDRLTKEQRSRTMSKIRSAKTGFEKEIFRRLRKQDVYFKTHHARIIGKPDIALPKSHKVVFLHSDFWHGWQLPRWEKILPNNFWKRKIRKNRQRDRYVAEKLRQEGWKVMVMWEHSFRKNSDGCVDKMVKFLK